MENRTPINDAGISNLVVPAEVAHNPNLSAKDGYVFALIDGLSYNEFGYCYASNNYIGKYLDYHPRSVSRSISKLEENYYIETEIIQKSDGKTVRKIYINHDYPKIYAEMLRNHYKKVTKPENDEKKIIKGRNENKETPPPSQKCEDPLHKNVNGGFTKMSRNLDSTYRNNDIESVQNPRKDSGTLTFGKSERKVNRKVKRKKPSKSMNDKVKEKAQNKAPKSKNSNNAAKGSKDDTDLLDLWNRQPNLRSHKNPTSDVYKQCLKKLKTLRTGKLSQIVKSNELKNGVFAADIPTEWAKTAWKKKDIAKAIKNLNEWCKEGNYPKKKDWLKKLSLDAAIYNPRTGTSVLLSAFKNGVQPLFNPYEKLQDEKEKIIFEDFSKFFGEPTEIRKQQQLIELTQSFSGARERHNLAWVRHDREWDNGLSSDNGISANSIYLVRQYINYLKGKDSSNISEFKLRANASPQSLKIDGFVFNKFREDYRYHWNVDPVKASLD